MEIESSTENKEANNITNFKERLKLFISILLSPSRAKNKYDKVLQTSTPPAGVKR
jgi:hypothetical protein